MNPNLKKMISSLKTKGRSSMIVRLMVRKVTNLMLRSLRLYHKTKPKISEEMTVKMDLKPLMTNTKPLIQPNKLL